MTTYTVYMDGRAIMVSKDYDTLERWIKTAAEANQLIGFARRFSIVEGAPHVICTNQNNSNNNSSNGGLVRAV